MINIENRNKSLIIKDFLDNLKDEDIFISTLVEIKDSYYYDRLLRFGAELIFSICEAKEVEVVIINKGEDSTFEEDLAKDVLEIITVFSARLYGARSKKNKKLIEEMRKAVDVSSQD